MCGRGKAVNVGGRARVQPATAIFLLGAAHNREVVLNLPRKKTLPSAEPS